MNRGEIWWASLPEPRGSEPGYRRPVLIIQSNSFNTSQIHTVIVATITSNMVLANAPGNVRLRRAESRLKRDSVVNVSQILTLDKRFLTEQITHVSPATIAEIEGGLRLVLSL